MDEVDLGEPDAVIHYDRPPGWAILAPHSTQGVLQVIDRLVGLVLAIAVRPTPTGIYVYKSGTVRLVLPVLSWPALVDLCFTEIRTYGVQAPQVTRRLRAAFDDLLGAVPDDRKPPLERHRDLLCEAVERVTEVPSHREIVFTADRLGLG